MLRDDRCPRSQTPVPPRQGRQDGHGARRPAVDVGGAPRLVDGDGDGKAVVDMGAYEGQPPLPHVVGDAFHPLTPARILDTRSGLGSHAQRLGQGGTIDLQVTGRGGVPAAGVSSVVLNVTVTETTATSFLTAWPAGITRPLASNLNYDAGRTVPNMVTVKVGAGGKVSLYNHSGSTHVVADVAGWYGATGGSPYTSVTPSRILDTRAGVGAPVAPVGPASTIPLKVTGLGGVPESGVSAVVLKRHRHRADDHQLPHRMARRGGPADGVEPQLRLRPDGAQSCAREGLRRVVGSTSTTTQGRRT